MQVKRFELKFYIPRLEYFYLAGLLKNCLDSDKYSKDGPYFIRSLYFDSLNDKAFEEKLAGIERRQKFRLRIYNIDAKSVKFEIKNKVNNQIFKETAIVSRKDALEVQSGNLDVLLKYNNPILNKIYWEFKRSKFSPVVIVDYKREAFTYPINNVRITFDDCLSSNTSNFDLFNDLNNMRPLLNNEKLIMEIKYDGFLPEGIKSLLKISRFERSAISKYCMGRSEVLS